MNTISQYKNCGGRIVLVNFALGESWRHQPGAAAFHDRMTIYCEMTVAEPIEEPDDPNNT